MAVKSRSKTSSSKRTTHRTGSVRGTSTQSKSRTSRSRTSAKPAGRTASPRAASSRGTASRSTSSRSTGSRSTKARSTASRSATPRSSTRSARSRTATSRTANAARSKRESHITTDHEEIQKWAEERGAQPACVKGTGRGRGDVGMIRLDFPGFSGEESLQPVSWEEWFDSFEENNLALVYEDTMASGKKSNFNKIVSRERNASTRL